MEKINCVICNQYSNDPYITSENLTFTLVKCYKCNLVYLNPRPTKNEIVEYYDDSYYPYLHKYDTFYDKLYTLVNKIALRWKKYHINKHSKNNEFILDVGSGNNNFIHFMKKNGEWLQSLSYDEYNKSTNTISNIDNIKSNTCDVITFWHSLEHIHDINIILTKCKRILKKDGYIFIACPNINAIEKKYFNKSWIAYDFPRHLYHFSPNTISKLLDKNNIKLISYHRMIHDTIFNIIKSKNSFLFAKIFIVVYSLIVITLFKKRSSSILYVCQI